MDDVVILKATNDVDDRIHLTDIGQELVTQSLPLTRPLDQAGDVHELHPSGNRVLTVAELSEPVEPFIRYRHRSNVGLDGAEGEVGCLGLGVGDQGIEQGGLANVGQSDDSGFKHRRNLPASGENVVKFCGPMLQTLRRPVSDPQLNAVDRPIKPKRKRPKPLTLAIAGLALIGVATALRIGPLAGNQRDLTQYVTTAERGVLSGLISASGELLAVQKVNVSPRKQGLLEQLLVDEGDVVKEGQLLAVMDPGDLEDRLQERQALLLSLIHI